MDLSTSSFTSDDEPVTLVDDVAFLTLPFTRSVLPTWQPPQDRESTGECDEDPGTRYARCSDGNGTLSHLFFSEDDHDLARAKAICAPCGLRVSCLEGAVERSEPYGVWGGKLVIDGHPVEVKPRRGRPPKHPRPVIVVDEAPIPAHLVA